MRYQDEDIRWRSCKKLTADVLASLISRQRLFNWRIELRVYEFFFPTSPYAPSPRLPLPPAAARRSPVLRPNWARTNWQIVSTVLHVRLSLSGSARVQKRRARGLWRGVRDAAPRALSVKLFRARNDLRDRTGTYNVTSFFDGMGQFVIVIMSWLTINIVLCTTYWKSTFFFI